MTVSTPLKRVAPYAQQLLYDEEVQDALRRAVGAGREAYGRAHQKGARDAVDDKRLWRRLRQAAEAASEAWTAVSTPASRRKPRWGRRLAVLGVGAGAVLLAANADARATVLDLLGKKDANSAQ